jgi:hypothetical protein
VPNWVVLAPATHDGSRGGIAPEAFGVVDVFLVSQTAGEGLTQQGYQAVLGVLSGAGVVQGDRGRA